MCMRCGGSVGILEWPGSDSLGWCLSVKGLKAVRNELYGFVRDGGREYIVLGRGNSKCQRLCLP